MYTSGVYVLSFYSCHMLYQLFPIVYITLCFRMLLIGLLFYWLEQLQFTKIKKYSKKSLKSLHMNITYNILSVY